jgi:hypothetical protein
MPRLGGPYNWTGDTTWKAGKSIWLWFIPPIKMVMTGGYWGMVYDIVLTTL